MSYSQERTNLVNISKYLERLEVPFEFMDIGDECGDVFPALISTFQYSNLSFDVILYAIGRWINVKCLVLDTAGLSSQVRANIYETCLELNYNLNEVTFSAFKGNVYIEIDCLYDISFDDFEAEFNSIPDGIEAFVDLMNKEHTIELESTQGKAKSASPKPLRKEVS